MPETDSPDPTPAEVVNKNVKRAMFEAEQKTSDLESALEISHAAAWRALSGQRAWRFEELSRIAAWLEIDPDSLLPDGGLTWPLVLSLT